MKNLTFKPGCYLAFVLSDRSHNELIKLFPPTFERVLCHHVTIDFQVTKERLAKLQTLFGDDPSVNVTGILVGENVECFTVEIDGYRARLDGGYYHITHSLRPPAKPVDSNKLLVTSLGKPSRTLSGKLSGTFSMVKK